MPAKPEETIDEPDCIQQFDCPSCFGSMWLREGFKPYFCCHCGLHFKQKKSTRAEDRKKAA